MKGLFAVAFATVLVVTVAPSCTVHTCRRVVKECYVECYGTCCDRDYCWECDCHNVCYDECFNDTSGVGH